MPPCNDSVVRRNRSPISSSDVISIERDLDDKKEYKATISITKFDSLLLCVSSCCFLLPAIYGLLHGFMLYALVSSLSTIFSINYWRDAIMGWRRNIDLIMAKTCFVVYFCSGLYYVRELPYFLIGITGCILFLYAFYKSNKLFENNNPNWCYFHAFFHLGSSCIQLLVLYAGCCRT